MFIFFFKGGYSGVACEKYTYTQTTNVVITPSFRLTDDEDKGA